MYFTEQYRHNRPNIARESTNCMISPPWLYEYGFNLWLVQQLFLSRLWRPLNEQRSSEQRHDYNAYHGHAHTAGLPGCIVLAIDSMGTIVKSLVKILP